MSDWTYGLTNVAVFHQKLDCDTAPTIYRRSSLHLEQRGELLTEEQIDVHRDLGERTTIATYTANLPPPVYALVDGPLELWGPRNPSGQAEYQTQLKQYLLTLEELRVRRIILAGYVDTPRAGLVTRLLEIALLAQTGESVASNRGPLWGVDDIRLFGKILPPGCRSAMFRLASRSSGAYPGDLALAFFYLNTGDEGYPVIARIDTVAWVAQDAGKIDHLHSLLVEQCAVIEGLCYPHCLLRAHQEAIVGAADRQYVDDLIQEHLAEIGLASYPGRTKSLAKSLGRMS